MPRNSSNLKGRTPRAFAVVVWRDTKNIRTFHLDVAGIFSGETIFGFGTIFFAGLRQPSADASSTNPIGGEDFVRAKIHNVLFELPVRRDRGARLISTRTRFHRASVPNIANDEFVVYAGDTGVQRLNAPGEAADLIYIKCARKTRSDAQAFCR